MTQPKFSRVFKSFEALRQSGAFKTVPLAKSAPARPAFPSKYHHFRSQELAKRLRETGTGGFWAEMRDCRYDEPVVATLLKAGASEDDVAAFLGCAKGAELGASLFGRVAKTMGLAAHVERMYGQWKSGGRRPIQRAQLRKSATELVTKTGWPEEGREPRLASGVNMEAIGPHPDEDDIAKRGNPYHDPETGRFTSAGQGVVRSEGRGAVTEKEHIDKDGVPRVFLRSVVKGTEITLDMRKDVMDKIRSGELKLNPDLAPSKWGAGTDDPKLDEFAAANGYRPAAEMEARFGKGSEPVKLNQQLGAAIGRAWARIEQASNFAPGEAMYGALLYKADSILRNAAVPLQEKLKAYK